jgi:putative nucleotidyltransferase with HDIG domain
VADRILIVDDDPQVRKLLRDVLPAAYVCEDAADGVEALEQLARSPFDLALVDVRMPRLDGMELLRTLKQSAVDGAAGALDPAAVIMITSFPDVDSAVTALRLGASDYVYKPIQIQLFRQTVERSLEQRRLEKENREYQQGLEALVERRTTELLTTYRLTLAALGSALDCRDSDTHEHTERVAKISVTLGRELGVYGAALRDLEWGALIHDIGKIGIPDDILRKPGPLTPDEWRTMRRHPEIGYRMLRDIPFLQHALELVRCHHEAWDGTGYPRGLCAEEIPLSARIFKVADVFDALTTRRPYHEAMSPEAARQYLQSRSGSEFDPEVVCAFVRCFPRLLAARTPTRTAASE